MYSFIALQQKVLRLCKATTINAEITAMAKDALNKAQYDIARERRELVPDLRVSNQIISVTTFPSTGRAALPNNFMMIDQVNYTSGLFSWQLAERNQRVPPAKVSGKPKAYYIVQPSAPSTVSFYGIAVTPFANCDDGTDTLVIDYYKAPTLMTGDTDTLLSNLIEEEVINRAEQLFMVYRGNLQNLQVLQSMNQGVASESPEDRSPPNSAQ